jgi:hypothetical protein
MRQRDPSSRDVVGHVNHDIKIYAEYRQIQTNNGDNGKSFFRKEFKMPSDFFANGTMPVCFVNLEYRGKAISKINPIISSPDPHSITLRAHSNGDTFEDGMNYFANILVLSLGSNTVPTTNFLPVDWGEDDEKLQISSLALNQMAENIDYLTHNRVQGSLRNVDYRTKDPDFYVRYLNNRLILYGKYEEFNPIDDNFDKNDNTDEDAPKKFIRSFEFPQHIFNIDAHPVVIANVGAKISTTTEPVRQLSCILKEVRAKGFKLEIREHSPTYSFTQDQIYFVSYIAVGERFPGDD